MASLPALFELASRTHPGCVREANEDSCAVFVDTDCAGLIVADGVSGQRAGGTASQMAVELTLEALRSQSRSTGLGKRLYRAVQRANIAIVDAASRQPELRGMSTTLTAVLVAEGELFAAHVGDCRLYLYRDERLEQLTRDHTVSAERVRFGLLSRAAALQHPARSTLTRSLGTQLVARVDQLHTRITSSDRLLICSDGVHSVLDETELVASCAASSSMETCEYLIRAATDRVAPDNLSVAVLRVTGSLPPLPRKKGLFRAFWSAFGQGPTEPTRPAGRGT